MDLLQVKYQMDELNQKKNEIKLNLIDEKVNEYVKMILEDKEIFLHERNLRICLDGMARDIRHIMES